MSDAVRSSTHSSNDVELVYLLNMSTIYVMARLPTQQIRLFISILRRSLGGFYLSERSNNGATLKAFTNVTYSKLNSYYVVHQHTHSDQIYPSLEMIQF